MARGDQTRNVRKDAPLTDRQAVVLPQSRRFFTAQGSGQGIRTAKALTNALGIATDAYEGKIERDNLKGASRAVHEAASGEERNAEDANRGYNEAYDQVEASNDLAAFASELPEMLEKEGWSDLPEDQAQARIDQYFSAQLEGINPDSVYGQIVAEGILKQNAQLLEVHRGFKSEQAQQERRIMIDNEMRTDYENNDGVLDHDKLMDRLGKLVPGPGGRLHYLESVFDIAKDEGDVGIIDSIPEFFPNGEPTGITDPNMEDLFDAARVKAQATFDTRKKAAEDQFKADYQTDRAQLHSALTTEAKAGNMGVIPDIVAGAQDGPNGEPRLLSRAQEKTLYDQLSAAQASNAVNRVDGDLFGSARAFGLSTTDYDNAAVQFAGDVEEMYRRENPDWDDEKVQSETLKIIIERSFRMDRVPKYIADFVNATPANPERFQEAVNVKAMLDAYDPTLFQRTVTDRNAALMGAYELALIDTGNPEGAMDFVSQYDETRMDGRKGDVADIAEIALDNLASDAGFFSSDFPITRNDTMRARALGEHYINLGYDDDRVAGFIETGMRARNVRVNGVMYPADFGWQTGDEAAEAYLRATPGNEFFTDAENLSMTPHPTKHGYVTIQDTTSMLPGSLVDVKVSEIEAWHDKNQNEQLIRMAEGSEVGISDKMKEAEHRAFRETYPPVIWGKAGDRSNQRRQNRDAWADMDPEQKSRLIQKQLKTMSVLETISGDEVTYNSDDFDENGEFIRNPVYMSVSLEDTKTPARPRDE